LINKENFDREYIWHDWMMSTQTYLAENIYTNYDHERGRISAIYRFRKGL